MASSRSITFAVFHQYSDMEKITILGQVVEGVKVADLKIGQEMELVLDTLLEDDETETIVWKWKPVGGNA